MATLEVMVALIKERARNNDGARVEGTFKALDSILKQGDRDYSALPFVGRAGMTIREALVLIARTVRDARVADAEADAVADAMATLQKSLD